MPRVDRQVLCHRAQRHNAPTTWAVAPQASGCGRGGGSHRSATLPTSSMGVVDQGSSNRGRVSRRSANLSQSPAVVPTGSLSNQPGHEPPHDLEYLHSVICAEVQQALATVVPHTATLRVTTQQAPPSSSASAALITSTPVESSGTTLSQQSGQMALLCVRACGYAWGCADNFDGRGYARACEGAHRQEIVCVHQGQADAGAS